MSITVKERAIVWEASADARFGHACEPRIVRRANGEILLAHRLGTRRESNDGRPHLLRSADRGRTWESLGQPLDGLGQEGWDLRGTALAGRDERIHPGIEIAAGHLVGHRARAEETHCQEVITHQKLPATETPA